MYIEKICGESCCRGVHPPPPLITMLWGKLPNICKFIICNDFYECILCDTQGIAACN